MGLAENLLNTLSTDEIVEEDYVLDEEEHIVIDETRRITVPNKLRTIAVTGDKDIETVTIDCIRYWDEHDLSGFALYINYVLPNNKSGTYIPQNVSIEEKHISFTWTIGSEITASSGNITFSVEAVKTDDNGMVIYQWGSLPNSDMNIPKGLTRGKIPSGDIETDIISQVLQSVNEINKIATEVENIAEDVTTPYGDINVSLDGIIRILESYLGAEFKVTDSLGVTHTYSFVNGMKWNEFISRYLNVDNFFIAKYGTIRTANNKRLYLNSSEIKTTDFIVVNGEYEEKVFSDSFKISENGSTTESYELTFEIGMTWEEWVDTSYNTVGIYVDGDFVRHPSTNQVYYDGTAVKSDDIIESVEYYWESTVITLTFKIGEYGSGAALTTYTFVEGMTWAAWVANTRYNTDGFYLDGNRVCTATGEVVFDGSNGVSANSAIVANREYRWVDIRPNFTIGEEGSGETTTYTFEDGMTWAEFIASNYNTDNFFISEDGYVWTSNGKRLTYNSVVIPTTEEIVPVRTYTLVIPQFTIGVSGGTTTTYQFEKGMTWAYWIDSEYNTASFKVENELVYDAEGKQVYYDGTAVSSTEDIIADRAYTLVTLFQFTIGESDTTDNDYTLTFVEDMIWSDWVASDYNTVGFTASGTSVYHPDGDPVYYGYTAVKTTDAIKAGERYAWREVSTFTLYVNDLEWYGQYTFEVDMTWSEFIDSGFNTSVGFTYENGYVYAPNGNQVYDSYIPVTPDNTISSDSYFGRATKSFTVTKTRDNITTTYFFDEGGMTWAAWILSDYNTGGFWLDDDAYVRSDSAEDNIYVWADGVTIPLTDAIIADKEYECRAATKSFTAEIPRYNTTTIYNFEEGMTWSEWVVSGYNTDGDFWVDDDADVRWGAEENNAYVWADGVTIPLTDAIIADKEYECRAVYSSFTVTMGEGGNTYGTYLFEEGMTWSDWVASGHNQGFTVSGDYIRAGNNQTIKSATNVHVTPTELIIAGKKYFY